MNPQELHQSAPRLAESNCAYVIFNNGDRGIIVPPGVFGKKITVRACDADGVQSGPVRKLTSKDLRLEPLPAPPAPLRLAPWCVNCGNAATLRCSACGSSICGVPWGGDLLKSQRLMATLNLFSRTNCCEAQTTHRGRHLRRIRRLARPSANLHAGSGTIHIHPRFDNPPAAAVTYRRRRQPRTV